MDCRSPYDVQLRGIYYNIPGISVQAAAMAATAAASGQDYPLYPPLEPSLQRSSPRIGGKSGVAVKIEGGSRSPHPISFLPTQTQQLQHQQLELDGRAQEEPAQFVNAKQF